MKPPILVCCQLFLDNNIHQDMLRPVRQLTSEQLPEIVVVGGLEEVQPPDVAEVGGQLLGVTLTQHLRQGDNNHEI